MLQITADAVLVDPPDIVQLVYKFATVVSDPVKHGAHPFMLVVKAVLVEIDVPALVLTG